MEPSPTAAPLPRPVVVAVDPDALRVSRILAKLTGGRPVWGDTTDMFRPGTGSAETWPVVYVASGDRPVGLDVVRSGQASADSAGRRIRASLVILLPSTADVREEVDKALDEDGRPLVDAVIFVPTRSDEAAATAIEAWLRLRHDAPSTAFGDLRDSSGRSCRYATVNAVAVAAPPEPRAAAAGVGGSRRVEVAVAASIEALTTEVDEAGGGLEPLPAAELGQFAERALDRLVADLEPADAATLQAAADQLGASSQAVVEETALTEARLALARDESALDAENARTGIAAKFGRRKRLEPLTAAVSASREAVAAAVASTDRAQALSSLRRIGVAQLSAAAQDAAESDREAAASALATAREAWLERTVAQAAGLDVPFTIDAENIGRAWSGATPEVRRYLLLPVKSRIDIDRLPPGAITPGGSGGVAVVAVEDLQRPLAVALLLGFSVAAVVDR